MCLTVSGSADGHPPFFKYTCEEQMTGNPAAMKHGRYRKIRGSGILFIFFSLIICLKPEPVLSCTAFCLDNGNRPVFGRNFDWSLGDALVIINKRGITKKAISTQTGDADKQFKWVSRYASATFNQFGREFPLGGMNEAGLVVAALMLDTTRMPQRQGSGKHKNVPSQIPISP